jgi:hypothetical protein
MGVTLRNRAFGSFEWAPSFATKGAPHPSTSIIYDRDLQNTELPARMQSARGASKAI